MNTLFPIESPPRKKKDKRDPSQTISFKDEQEKLLKDTQRHIQILGVYMSYRQKSLKEKLVTWGQLQQFISRHVKDAMKITSWNDKQISEAFAEAELKYKDIDWTIQSVWKLLTK